jgi:hypothetical protein
MLQGHPSLIFLIVMLLVVIPGLWRMQVLSDRSNHLARCVDHWANDYQDRTTQVSVAAAERQDALDTFLRALNTKTSPRLFIDLREYVLAATTAAQTAALDRIISDSEKSDKPALTALIHYKEASDHYSAVIARYPIKQLAQKLDC